VACQQGCNGSRNHSLGVVARKGIVEPPRAVMTKPVGFLPQALKRDDCEGFRGQLEEIYAR
jgi:hypothetical protein